MHTSTTTFSQVKIRELGLSHPDRIHYQLPPEELVKETLKRREGKLNDTGALLIETGQFTGRCPKDKFIVRDALTSDTVFWNDFNQPIDDSFFDPLYRKVMQYLDEKDVWIRDCYACADPAYRLNIRVINEQPAANLFCYNMFGRPDEHMLEHFEPEWQVIHAPGFKSDPKTDGTNSDHFALISFERRLILIGGTAYTGEIKKGVFSVLNFLLPTHSDVLPMHCSANAGEKGDTALFFGLSGTGKTTLSTDPDRKLIGDDEHGWASEVVFNFEGGCYAKCIDLSEATEPDIYHAIKPGALVENTVFYPGTHSINFADKSITENTRVSYPLPYIPHIVEEGMGVQPDHIFFLSCDAYGVLPPISRLNHLQAMYYFLSGYTAKVAGTETGITEPKSTFSACFGAPFLPLHPARYAEMLGQRIKGSRVKVWLINTGWTKGGYGQGQRMSLPLTRTMIKAAMTGQLDNKTFMKHPLFGLEMPTECPGVPQVLLNPRYTWADREAYDQAAEKLANQFTDNFKKYEEEVGEEVRVAGPKVAGVFR
jgi:phosphoenolpyruvate carboxykinase (ATP)